MRGNAAFGVVVIRAVHLLVLNEDAEIIAEQAALQRADAFAGKSGGGAQKRQIRRRRPNRRFKRVDMKLLLFFPSGVSTPFSAAHFKCNA